MAKILDEKQVGNSRLLVLDEPYYAVNNEVHVDGKSFKVLDVYDMPKSIALVCSEQEKSFIGLIIK